jgi:hypothetical protein
MPAMALSTMRPQWDIIVVVQSCIYETLASTLSLMALARHLQIAAQSSDEEELYVPLGTSSGGPETAYGAAEGDGAEAQVLPCAL